MPLDTSSPEFQRGRDAEKLIAQWMIDRGFHVLPCYDYSGKDDDKAPKLRGDKSYIIPDLDVCKGGKRYWVEVKNKGRITEHYRTGSMDVGMGKRLYENYLKVQEISGAPVLLMMLIEETQELLCQTLRTLGAPRVYSGDKMDR